MASSTWEGSREPDVQAEPLDAATKSDKINRSQIQKHLSVIRKTLGLGPDDVLIPFSGEKKTGVQELWAEIERFLD